MTRGDRHRRQKKKKKKKKTRVLLKEEMHEIGGRCKF